jgi:EpsI family protein
MADSKEAAAEPILTRATEHWASHWPGLLLGAAFALCFAEVLTSMVGQWWLNDRYSYGFLIPLLSFYLVWIRRRELAALTPSPSYLAGSLALLAGLGMLAVGAAGSVEDLRYLSLIVTLAGLALLVLGREFFKHLWFPIAYLLLMVPIWEYFTEPLHLPFQKFSANLGVAAMHWIGVPAYREGLFIFLPRITLEVARECSGVNYLVAVIALGIPLGYVLLATWTRRILLVIFSVIIAILSNALRVTFIGALLYFGVSRDVHGPGHILQGLFVSLIGYAAIFLGLWFLSRGASTKAPHRDEAPVPERRAASDSSVRPLCLGLTAVFMATGAFVHFYHPQPVPLARSLVELPATLGEWQGRATTREYPAFHEQGVDHELFRAYRDASGKEVRLYIGYYAHSRGDRELVQWHSAALHRGTERVRLEAPSLAVNRKLEDETPPTKLSIFWYEVAGKALTGLYETKAWTVWNSVARGRSDGAVILLATEVASEEDISGAERRLVAFLSEIHPLLDAYLPN